MATWSDVLTEYKKHDNEFKFGGSDAFLYTGYWREYLESLVRTVDKTLSEYKIPLNNPANSGEKGFYTLTSYDALVDCIRQMDIFYCENYAKYHEMMTRADQGPISDDITVGWNPGVYVPYVPPTPPVDPEEPGV